MLSFWMIAILAGQKFVQVTGYTNSLILLIFLFLNIIPSSVYVPRN